MLLVRQGLIASFWSLRKLRFASFRSFAPSPPGGIVGPDKILWPCQAPPPPPPHPSAVPLAPSVSWFPHCHYICSCLRRVHHPLACAMRSGCKARCPRVEINWGHLALRNCPVNLTIQNTGASSPPPPPPFSWHAPSSLHLLLF